MATRTSQFHLPNPTTGAQEIHHFETEIGQVVGLKEKFRQPSTSYTVGDIAYHASLPTGYYLECTTEGTSGSGDLTISSPSIGCTISDGTVVWTVTKNLSVDGGVLYNSKGSNYQTIITRNDDAGVLQFAGGTNLGSSGTIALFGNGYTLDPTFKGGVNIVANDGDEVSQLSLYKNGVLTLNTNDLGGAAIVAKSLGTNGYIKYASGLIVQWGFVEANTTGANVTLPISFTNINFRTVMGPNYTADDVPYTQVQVKYVSASEIVIRSSVATTGGIHWFAIGY